MTGDSKAPPTMKKTDTPRVELGPLRPLLGLALAAALVACSDSKQEPAGAPAGGSASAQPASAAPVPFGAPESAAPTPWVDDGQQRPNIVLCVIDTLRRDATALGEAEESAETAPHWPIMEGGLTPSLNALAEESAVFTHAYSAAPWTVPAHASLFTGLLPIVHNCVARSARLGPVGPTIAEITSKVGYETAAFYSNPWLSERATGLLRGFEVQQESPIGDLATLTNGEGDQGGGQTLRNVDAWLGARQSQRPFLMFVNILEAHLPYAPPAAIREMSMPPLPPTEVTSIQWAHEFNAGLHPAAEVDWGQVAGLYAGDVRYADALFGTLLDVLRKHGVFDDTIIIVTSDHGENLGDHGRVEHQFDLHESLIAVPLIARVPGGELPKGRYTSPVMTTDIFATVAELAKTQVSLKGRGNPPLMRSLKNEPRKKQRAVFADYMRPHLQLLEFAKGLNPELDMTQLDRAYRTVRVGPMRLTAGSDGSFVLHDMSADPRQLTDVAGQHQDIVDGLKGMLARAQPKGPPPQAAPHQMDAQTREQLKSLGYVPGGDDE